MTSPGRPPPLTSTPVASYGVPLVRDPNTGGAEDQGAVANDGGLANNREERVFDAHESVGGNVFRREDRSFDSRGEGGGISRRETQTVERARREETPPAPCSVLCGPRSCSTLPPSLVKPSTSTPGTVASLK